MLNAVIFNAIIKIADSPRAGNDRETKDVPTMQMTTIAYREFLTRRPLCINHEKLWEYFVAKAPTVYSMYDLGFNRNFFLARGVTIVARHCVTSRMKDETDKRYYVGISLGGYVKAFVNYH